MDVRADFPGIDRWLRAFEDPFDPKKGVGELDLLHVTRSSHGTGPRGETTTGWAPEAESFSESLCAWQSLHGPGAGLWRAAARLRCVGAFVLLDLLGVQVDFRVERQQRQPSPMNNSSRTDWRKLLPEPLGSQPSRRARIA